MNEEAAKSNDLLQKTHAKLCKRALAILEKENPTTAELEFVRRFLKDNNIDAIPKAGQPLGDVRSAAEEHFDISPGNILDFDDPALAQSVG